ncbi:MAG TPA: heat-inducible transcriptional repressor HrcA [Candidatus Competibacteraceae bacterium]|nr:heat-inducible transcriptional repressor HrcA [Candidatus Competibacteraceae bacterium]
MQKAIRNGSNPPLSERAQQLLKALVERYIRDGQPVGSRTLSRAGFDLSPATIRNVMADLEELGLVRAPHTSAGRVPTARGYRFFIDSLLSVQPLDSREVELLRRQLDPDQDTGSLIQSTSQLLSGLTRLAGVVMVPRLETRTLRQVEFLPLSDNRVLVILVINEQEVQNRIIHTERPYTSVELLQAANYLNQQFAGKDIVTVRRDLLQEMEDVRASMNGMMQTVIEMADKVFEDSSRQDEDYVVAGQTNLMGFAELSDVEKLRQLFETFNRKRDILNLFDQCLNAQGVQIFIGEEVGFDALEQCSVVTAPYSVNGRVLGVLGVIGPTRMAYERIIPIVDVTAKLLAATLNSRQ